METRRREFIGAAFAAAVGATTKTLHAQQAARAPSADPPQVSTWQPQVERLFKSPDMHPNALEAAPDGLWIGDQVSEKVLKVDWTTGEILFELQTESHNMSGLAIGAGYSRTGPKSGGGMRCVVAASYADAARRSIGSSPGPAQNEMPTGSGESSRVCRLLVTLS